jgi:hypothetical protein
MSSALHLRHHHWSQPTSRSHGESSGSCDYDADVNDTKGHSSLAPSERCTRVFVGDLSAGVHQMSGGGDGTVPVRSFYTSIRIGRCGWVCSGQQP